MDAMLTDPWCAQHQLWMGWGGRGGRSGGFHWFIGHINIMASMANSGESMVGMVELWQKLWQKTVNMDGNGRMLVHCSEGLKMFEAFVYGH